MRVEPTSLVNRSSRVPVDRPGTMRDPSRAPVDVRVRNLSATGALLDAEAELPTGTLVSLGIAGAGIQLARVVRTVPGGMAIEFMLPLDATAVAAAGRVETLTSVAFPQMLAKAPAAPPTPVDGRAMLTDGRLAGFDNMPTSGRSRSLPVWTLAAVGALAVLIYVLY